MIAKPLNEVVESDIQELKDSGVAEGKTIEYKREFPGGTDEEKREFLADVSSFANTEGGDIIYGVVETQGLITDIFGLSSPDLDAAKLRLENLIRDGISPRIRVELRLTSGGSGTLLVIRIDKSWNGPHRVVFRGHDKFYGRTSAGKFPLDVGQLRTAFMQSATQSEQIQGFRVDRIIDISNGRTPVMLPNKAKLVLHIVPLGALSEQSQFDVTVFKRNPVLHRPWNVSPSFNWRMTFDGALGRSPTREDGSVGSYVQFYRNGIVEATTTLLLEMEQADGQRVIPHVELEERLIKYLPEAFKALEGLGVRPPVSVALTLIGVQGLRMAMGGFTFDPGSAIAEEILTIPGSIVDTGRRE